MPGSRFTRMVSDDPFSKYFLNYYHQIVAMIIMRIFPLTRSFLTISAKLLIEWFVKYTMYRSLKNLIGAFLNYP